MKICLFGTLSLSLSLSRDKAKAFEYNQVEIYWKKRRTNKTESFLSFRQHNQCDQMLV